MNYCTARVVIGVGQLVLLAVLEGSVKMLCADTMCPKYIDHFRLAKMAFRGFQLQTCLFQPFQHLAEGCNVVVKCLPRMMMSFK